MRRTIGICALAAALVAAGCGSDDAVDPASAPTSTVAVSIATTTLPEEPSRTTIPLVTVPEGDVGDERAQREPGEQDQGGQGAAAAGSPDTTARPDAGAPADPATTSPPATALAPSGIPELDDVLEGQPVIEPPEGAGTAMRATIAPLDDLAVGDVVTIEAENAPPGQLMAYAQCTEAAIEAVVLLDLLSSCGTPQVGDVGSDGTVTVTVTVAASVAEVDCRLETCVVGLIVFPGTDGLRVYEPITLAA